MHNSPCLSRVCLGKKRSVFIRVQGNLNPYIWLLTTGQTLATVAVAIADVVICSRCNLRFLCRWTFVAYCNRKENVHPMSCLYIIAVQAVLAIYTSVFPDPFLYAKGQSLTSS